MTEIKQTTSPQDETTRRAVLVIQSLAGSTFLFGALGTYLAITTGAWQSIAFAAWIVLAEVILFSSITHIRRGRVNLGGWIILVANTFGTVFAAMLYVSLGYVAAAYGLVTSFFIIRYVMPRDTQRYAIFVASVGLVVTIAAEVFNPAWRQTAQLFLTLAPIITTILGIAFIAVIARQAWGGNIRLKIVTAFTIVALVSLGILGTVTYFNYRNQIREDIRQRLLNIASITATQLDADMHAAIQTPEDMAAVAYQQMQAQGFEIVATDPDLEYIYTMRMNEQGQIYFIIDVGQGEYEPGDVGVIYEEPSELLLENFTVLGNPIAEEDIYTDEYGSVLSAYAPFYRADGSMEGIVGVDIAADKILAQESAVLYLILGTIAGAMVLVTLLGLWLGNLFTRPILDLAVTAQQVAEGDLSARAEVETTDEVGDLAGVFNTMTAQLQETLEGLEQRVADRTKALETSAEVGRRLSAVTDPHQLAVEIVEQVQRAFDYYYAQIYLFDEADENLVLTGGTGEAGAAMMARGHSLPAGRGLVGRAADTNASVLIPDTSQEAGWLPNELLPDTKTETAVPISIGNQVLGVLDVQHSQVNGLTEDDVTLLESLASQAAISLQNARSYEQSRSQAELESLVNVIGQKIQRATTMEDTLQTAIRELGTAIGASRVKAKLAPASSAVATEPIAPPDPVTVVAGEDEVFDTEHTPAD